MSSKFACAGAARAARSFVLVFAALLAGCSMLGSKPTPFEVFDSTGRYTRRVPVTAGQACEGARRALLSQGYVVAVLAPEQVSGRKNFQGEGGAHVQIEVQVVCTADLGPSRQALVFASGLQDRYELKKGASNASLGVGAVGSVSLPFSAGGESLVKVASETITSDDFYTRFFAVMDRYLQPLEGTPPDVPAPATPNSATTGPAPTLEPPHKAAPAVRPAPAVPAAPAPAASSPQPLDEPETPISPSAA